MESQDAGTVPPSPQPSESLSTSTASNDSSPTASSSPTTPSTSPPATVPTPLSESSGTSVEGDSSTNSTSSGSTPSASGSADQQSTKSTFTEWLSSTATTTTTEWLSSSLNLTSPGTSGTPSLKATTAAPPAKKLKKKSPDEKSQDDMAAVVPKKGLALPLRVDWDPKRHSGSVGPTSVAMSRIKKDLQEFYKHPPEGIYLLVRDEDISCLDVLIVGPKETPYQGGFFHFYLSFSDNYPFQPPRVKLMTTGNGKVRFNPNFYQNGKVCLSILGTWTGPQWNASQTLTSVLCSIQSLMSEEPYRNEPGFDKMKKDDKNAVDYRFIIRHETMRVAVCDTIMGETTCPKSFIERVVKPTFVKNYQSYVDAVANVKERQPICMFSENEGPFSFAKLKERLQALKAEIDAETLDPKKGDGDFRVLGVPVSEDVDTASKRNPWMEQQPSPAADDVEIEDWDDIFYQDSDEDENEVEDISDLSDFQEDDAGESGGVTSGDREKSRDKINNNEGDDANVAEDTDSQKQNSNKGKGKRAISEEMGSVNV